MNNIGIAIYKNEIYYCVFDTEERTLIKGALNYNIDSSTLMSDFRNLFIEIINNYQPSLIAFKVSIDIRKLTQYKYMYYPLGILGLLCEENGIICIERSNRWITSKINNRNKCDIVRECYSSEQVNKKNIQAAVLSYFNGESEC